MLSIESLRKVDGVATKNLTDEEIEKLRENFYSITNLMFDDWCEEKFSSKTPVGLLTKEIVPSTL